MLSDRYIREFRITFGIVLDSILPHRCRYGEPDFIREIRLFRYLLRLGDKRVPLRGTSGARTRVNYSTEFIV